VFTVRYAHPNVFGTLQTHEMLKIGPVYMLFSSDVMINAI